MEMNDDTQKHFNSMSDFCLSSLANLALAEVSIISKVFQPIPGANYSVSQVTVLGAKPQTAANVSYTNILVGTDFEVSAEIKKTESQFILIWVLEVVIFCAITLLWSRRRAQ